LLNSLSLLRAAALITLAATGFWTEQARPFPDVDVKAAFVARFPDFVSWPQGRRATEQTRLCLSPSHSFETLVREAAEAATGRSRPLIVHQLRMREPLGHCHVLYVAPQDHDLLPQVRDQPILTVGDEPDFCERGGVINFRIVGGRVRFEIGLAQAQRVGLGIHPQLLQLATRVYGGQP
jgi:hypothetical protein